MILSCGNGVGGSQGSPDGCSRCRGFGAHRRAAASALRRGWLEGAPVQAGRRDGPDSGLDHASSPRVTCSGSPMTRPTLGGTGANGQSRCARPEGSSGASWEGRTPRGRMDGEPGAAPPTPDPGGSAERRSTRCPGAALRRHDDEAPRPRGGGGGLQVVGCAVPTRRQRPRGDRARHRGRPSSWYSGLGNRPVAPAMRTL